ncbi:HIG1 domain family member 1C-like [Actinia tenebrosa]|uniref:HIG1 domain family member 1C-like n=1 Tax=Actinia tenebrosa TaxID=6105 RepID=A0A6P8IQC2_ACTTE|nr:HIG1 domain family member 1C-like [Actinia tenebrosa]
MAPSKDSHQLSSQWQTLEEKESPTEKMMRKSRDQPFIPIGIVGLVGACVWGAIAYRHRGPMSTSRYLMRLRVIAQSCVVGSIMVGLGVTALQDSGKKEK